MTTTSPAIDRLGLAFSQSEGGAALEDVIDPLALMADEAAMAALETDPGHAESGAVQVAPHHPLEEDRVLRLGLGLDVGTAEDHPGDPPSASIPPRP